MTHGSSTSLIGICCEILPDRHAADIAFFNGGRSTRMEKSCRRQNSRFFAHVSTNKIQWSIRIMNYSLFDLDSFISSDASPLVEIDIYMKTRGVLITFCTLASIIAALVLIFRLIADSDPRSLLFLASSLWFYYC